MSGGRYLWWLMVSAAGFISAAVLFEYVMWLTLRMWGCREIAASCTRLGVNIAGVIQSAAMFISAGVILTATIARLISLRLNLLWAVAATVWLGASLPFISRIDELWKTRILFSGHVLMPPEAVMFLAGLLILLSAPLEDFAKRASHYFVGMQSIVGMAVIYAILFAISVEPPLAEAALWLSGIPGPGSLAHLALITSQALSTTEFAATISSGMALVIFLFGITISLALHTRIDAAPEPKRCRRQEMIVRARRPQTGPRTDRL